MPTIFAHYHLGDLVLPELTEEQRRIIEAHRDCYDLGLQGPDFLFYYLLYPSKEPVRFGNDLHRMTFMEILTEVIAVRVEAARSEGRSFTAVREAFTPSELAYLYGFAGHYTLDASAHPYVNAEAGDDSALHFLIETDFDEALLQDLGIKPWEYKLTQCLPATREVRAAVAAFYAPWHDRVTPAQLKRSARSMPLIRAVIYTPTERRTRFITAAMKRLGFYAKHGPMLMVPNKPAPDAKSAERTEVLRACFAEGRVRLPQVLIEVDRALEGGEVSEFLHRDFL